MEFARNAFGDRIEPARKLSGFCPLCNEAVVAKCGEIKVHHWAHKSRVECDPWWENESQWHRDLKALAPPERREVIKPPHRADIVAESGTVIELQSTRIQPADIKAREAFYGKMIWIIDGSRFLDRFEIHERFDDRSGFKIRWKNIHKHWITARKPRFIDFGANVSIASLLAAKGFDTQTYGDNTYDHIYTYKDPERIGEIEQGLREPGVALYKIHTLYESGYGSVKLYTRESLIRMIRGENSPGFE